MNTPYFDVLEMKVRRQNILHEREITGFYQSYIKRCLYVTKNEEEEDFGN